MIEHTVAAIVDIAIPAVLVAMLVSLWCSDMRMTGVGIATSAALVAVGVGTSAWHIGVGAGTSGIMGVVVSLMVATVMIRSAEKSGRGQRSLR